MSASDHKAPQRLNLMISAGEASGDMHAAHAITALRQRNIEFDCFGMGANKLKDAGMELTLDCRELAVIGIVDVLINYPRFMRRLALLRKTMAERRPDMLIIVDYPDFNLKLAETAKQLGIPVMFYISPQIWAWRKKRIHRIGQLVSHMAVLFPFEVDVYKEAGIPVTYVGHPLVDDAKSELTQAQARVQLGLTDETFSNVTSITNTSGSSTSSSHTSPSMQNSSHTFTDRSKESQQTTQKIIALLPGSRQGELKRNLPVMLETAAVLRNTHPNIEFVLPIAPTLEKTTVDELLGQVSFTVHTVEGQSYHTMRAADAVLSASGTATLETAMLGTPMAVMYVINFINYSIMKRLIEIDDIGLVNIVAGKRICQEFVQENAQPKAMAQELDKCLFDADYRKTMLKELELVQQKMGSGGASLRVAELIETLVNTAGQVDNVRTEQTE